MNLTRKQGGDHAALIAVAVAVLLLVAGIVVTTIGMRGPAAPSAAPTTAASVSPTQSAPKQSDATPGPKRKKPRSSTAEDQPEFGDVLFGSPPVTLTIPSIGVQADTIVGLGLADDGSIEVPEDAANPGWFTPGPTPGQLGPAVIAGHLDSKTGPAVFYRLDELRAGDRVDVTRRDGSVATFAVDRVESFEKDEFPTRAVYGTVTRAELRLITCGGQYDDQDGGYQSNTVAFAHLV